MVTEINDAVRNEMLALLDDDGLLKPEAVVAAAANEASSMHKFFTWDDAKAAAKCRLEEARALIRNVECQYDENWLKGPVPAFVSLANDRGREGGGYRSTPAVLTNNQLRAELIATAKKELESWARRHKVLRGYVLNVLVASGIEPTGIFSESEIGLTVTGGGDQEAA